MAKNKYNYDLLIIGSGPAGLAAAGFALKHGLNAILIEKGTCEGGECVHAGCIPTKTMLHVSKVYRDAKNGGFMGIKSSTLGYNFPSIIKWRDLVVENTGVCNLTKELQKQGLKTMTGRFQFSSANSGVVGSEKITFERAIIATGGKAFIPPIEGLQEVGYLNYNQAASIKKIPKSVLIIGGSAIGCEFAQLFHNLGVKVTIVDRAKYLISSADVQASESLRNIYEESGLSLMLESKVVSAKKSGAKKSVTILDSENQEREVLVDEIIVASGKLPNLDLSLDETGVEYSQKGIVVDKNLSTNVPNISAIGDVTTNQLKFTHTAIYQAEVAIYNIVHPKHKKAIDEDYIAWNIFTDPELASFGITEQKAISSNIDYKVGICDMVEVARSDTNGEAHGFVKIITDKKSSQILGATILGQRAGEMIHELTLAAKYGITADQVASMVHVFPTWSEAVRIAAHRAS